MWTHSINPLVFPQSVKEPLYCGCFLILVNLVPIEKINLYLFHFVKQILLCLETCKLSFCHLPSSLSYLLAVIDWQAYWAVMASFPCSSLCWLWGIVERNKQPVIQGFNIDSKFSFWQRWRFLLWYWRTICFDPD